MTTIHAERSPLAGQTVKVRDEAGGEIGGRLLVVEDWWDRASGHSWMSGPPVPATIKYAIRSGFAGLPADDEVIYGHLASGFGHLVHVSEVEAAS